MEVILGYLVDVLDEAEGVDGGDVLEQLCFLAEDDADVLHVVFAVLPWVVAVDFDASTGGFDAAGEHLDSGAFSGAVGAEESDHFAVSDVETDVVDGLHCFCLSVEHAFEGGQEAVVSGVCRVFFAEVFDCYHWMNVSGLTMSVALFISLSA